MKLEEKRHWLELGQEPTLPFVIEYFDGRRGEALTPLHLLDLLIHEYFSDIDDIGTIYFMGVKTLRDVAGSFLAMNQIRARVYDGVGPVYDNGVERYKDEEKEQGEISFLNEEEPVNLDGWDAWTVVSSLIQAGYIKVYEKIPVWSDKQKKQGCDGCVFKQEKDGQPYCTVWESSGVFQIWDQACPFVSNGSAYEDYHEVLPEELLDGSFKPGWVPIVERKSEYVGYRKEMKS